MTRAVVRLTRLGALLSLAACATGPQIRGSEPVSLMIIEPADFYLNVNNAAEPSARPGALAGEGAASAFRDCASEDEILALFLKPLCAAIGAAAGAVTGAVVSHIETMPEEDAARLTQVSAQATSAWDWQQNLRAALEREARLRNVVVDEDGAETQVLVYLQNIEWGAAFANQAQIESTVQIVIRQDGQTHLETYEQKSGALQVDKWEANQGQPILDALQQIFATTSEKIWSDYAGSR